jgi:TPR repeat protein
MNQSIIDKYIKNINNGCINSLYYLADYYKHYEDYENMVKYYLKATEIDPKKAAQLINSYIDDNLLKYYLKEIENNNKYAMNILGVYYNKLKNEFNTKKYYMMAINNGCALSIINLGNYYYNRGYYNTMMKYYQIGIEQNDSRAMYECADYYKRLHDYKNMIKYYLMAIEQHNTEAMNQLGYYYETQSDYKNMFKYYLMAIEHNDTDAMNRLGLYYIKQNDYHNAKKYCDMSELNVYPELLQYVINHNILYYDHDNVMYYSLVGLNANYHDIVEHLFKYLLKHNKIKDMLEIYIICCDNGLYNNYQLNNFVKIINVDYNCIIKYSAERNIRVYELINKYLYCTCISTLICTF